MSPLALPDGTTFMRDDWKASVHTIPPALDFLGAAQAKRKVVVVGTISDTMGSAGRIYVNTARHALDVADVVCFVGPRASAALRAAPADRPDRLRAFGTVRAANQFLTEFLQPGDLILLKGSNQSDHLIRVALSRTMAVACWQTDCGRRSSCERCELVGVPSDASPKAVRDAPAEADGPDVASEWGQRFRAEPGAQILVGLGNPGDTRRGTPHNVGYELVDGLAETLNATWHNESDVTVAAAQWDGRAIWLVKPNAAMNLSGGALHRFAARAGFSPADCILVYDDHDLPLGTARTRLRGSDGGHRGVRSVLEAFQTDQFRRVKIGVKRASATGTAARETVLAPFDSDERSQVEAAFVLARQQLLALVQKPLPRPAETAAAPSPTR
jgi:aminoacyl-tRNA hydrolase